MRDGAKTKVMNRALTPRRSITTFVVKSDFRQLSEDIFFDMTVKAVRHIRLGNFSDTKNPSAFERKTAALV